MLLKRLNNLKPSQLIYAMIGCLTLSIVCGFVADFSYDSYGLKSVGFAVSAFLSVFYAYYLIRIFILFKRKIYG